MKAIGRWLGIHGRCAEGADLVSQKLKEELALALTQREQAIANVQLAHGRLFEVQEESQRKTFALQAQLEMASAERDAANEILSTAAADIADAAASRRALELDLSAVHVQLDTLQREMAARSSAAEVAQHESSRALGEMRASLLAAEAERAAAAARAQRTQEAAQEKERAMAAAVTAQDETRHAVVEECRQRKAMAVETEQLANVAAAEAGRLAERQPSIPATILPHRAHAHPEPLAPHRCDCRDVAWKCGEAAAASLHAMQPSRLLLDRLTVPLEAWIRQRADCHALPTWAASTCNGTWLSGRWAHAARNGGATVSAASAMVADAVAARGGPQIHPELLPPIGLATLLLPALSLAVVRRCCTSRRGRRRVAANASDGVRDGASAKLAATQLLLVVRDSTQHAALGAALRCWSRASRHVGACARRLEKLLECSEAISVCRVFAHWHSLAVGLQSALQQHRLQQRALMSVIQHYDDVQRTASSSQPLSSRRTATSTPKVRSQASATLGEASQELQGSLQTLGSNLVRLAREGSMDARAVASAPRRLLSASRELLPRLAEHVSPTRLLTSMVKELNDSLTASASMTTLTSMDVRTEAPSSSTTVPSAYATPPPHPPPRGTASAGGGIFGMREALGTRRLAPSRLGPSLLAPSTGGVADDDGADDGDGAADDDDADDDDGAADVLLTPSLIRPPTEAALRQHNEEQVSEAAAAAVAAAEVLARLNVHLSAVETGTGADGPRT